MGLLKNRKKEKHIDKDVSSERHLVKRDISVVGTKYHQDDLMKLAVKNDKEPVEEGYDRIYLYNFIHSPVELVPDPKNKHDKNAIKVVVNKQWIGFVPAIECLEVKDILNNHEVKYISCRITGGESVLWQDRKAINTEHENIRASVRIGYVE